MKNVIDKIQKLLSLSSSDNPNESALALSKAKILMNKYEINESDLSLSKIKESTSFVCRGKKPPSYICILGEGISRLFNCGFYNVSRWDDEVRGWVDEFIFVGFDPNQEIAKYCFDVLSVKLKKARKHYMKTVLKGVDNRPAKADAFALGWSIAVYQKVQDLVPKEEIETSNDLGLISINVVEQYIKNKVSGSVTPKKNHRSNDDEQVGFSE